MSGVGRIAVVGTGRMGAAMAGRLREAGIAVTVYNRTRATAEELAARTGAVVVATAREAAAAADVVVVSLADDAAAAGTYGGADGIAVGLRPGSVVLETSTIAPETVAALAALAEKQGAVLLDTPVSGSVAFAEHGELIVMAGGPAEALERARPVLNILAARVIHVGGSGAGAVMKLALNSVVHGLNLALSEALVLAERSGVAREMAYDVFAASAAGAPFVHYKRAAFVHPEDAAVGFTLGLVAKDLELILDRAERAGVPMEQAAFNLRQVRAAGEAGYADRDLSAMADFVRGH
ncbi:NAD(P)-dependent oxidoreductase [Streptomyces coryli]